MPDSRLPPPSDNSDSGSLHLKPEPPRPDAPPTRATHGRPTPGVAKDTAAISSSEFTPDTDGGTAAANERQTVVRRYGELKRGATLGKYVILDQLGQGGMGTVFRAEHRRMLREVALKVLSPDVLAAAQSVQRFHREVRVAAKLTHPNIVTAYDADEEQGIHFLVMEIVEGTSLAALVKAEGPLPVKKAVDHVVQAARGLEYAHSKGIVHRDIKPGNLMLDQFGTVKILDLGLARLDESGPAAADITDTGNVMGTIDYLSPEQAVNTKNADQRSDIYSLGCTLWFLLAGKPIYGGQTPVERILAHRDRPVPSLRQVRNDVSMELESLFRQMVAKSPDDRHQTMGDVLKAFERCHLGGNDTSASGYMLVAPLADEIPLADRSFALGQAVAPPPMPTPMPPPTPMPTFVPAAGDTGRAKSKSRSKTGSHRKPSKVPSRSSLAVVPVPATAPSLRKRKVVVGTILATGLAGILLIAWLIWSAHHAPPPMKKVASEVPKPDPPPRAVAPFSGDDARRLQERWKDFLGEPVEKRNSIGMRLVLIPSGEFDMGTSAEELGGLLAGVVSPVTQAQYRSETPPRRMTIDAPFYVGADEVTQAEYEELMGMNPSWFSRAGEGSARVSGADTRRHPVERASWIDAVEFCNRLSGREHLEPCYVVENGRISAFVASNGYRLPTEAEWEYACRAGSSRQFALPELEQGAWHDARSGGVTCPVGATQANAFGLFEMHGNVWEWCLDEYHEQRPERLGGQPTAGPLLADAERVVRGGSWSDGAADCRAAARSGRTPTFRGAAIGFRVVVAIPGPKQ